MMVTSMTQPATNAAQSMESRPSTFLAHALLTPSAPLRTVPRSAVSNGSHQHSHQMWVQATAAHLPTTQCQVPQLVLSHKLPKRTSSTMPELVSHTEDLSHTPVSRFKASALADATEHNGKSAATELCVSTNTNDAATQLAATDSPALALRDNEQVPLAAVPTQSTMTLGLRFALRRRT